MTSATETILHGLKKYTNYNITILAYTSGGDGVPTVALSCHTEQDVPGPPMAVKGVVMSIDSILVSWQPPSEPNGVLTQVGKLRILLRSADSEILEFCLHLQYTVYIRTTGEKEVISSKMLAISSLNPFYE